jgi:hypothetical protein
VNWPDFVVNWFETATPNVLAEFTGEEAETAMLTRLVASACSWWLGFGSRGRENPTYVPNHHQPQARATSRVRSQQENDSYLTTKHEQAEAVSRR